MTISYFIEELLAIFFSLTLILDSKKSSAKPCQTNPASRSSFRSLSWFLPAATPKQIFPSTHLASREQLVCPWHGPRGPPNWIQASQQQIWSPRFELGFLSVGGRPFWERWDLKLKTWKIYKYILNISTCPLPAMSLQQKWIYWTFWQSRRDSTEFCCQGLGTGNPRSTSFNLWGSLA